MSKKFSLLFFVLAFAAAKISTACDLCGCYTPQVETISPLEPTTEYWWNNFYLAVGEQFTRYGTVLVDGHDAPNPTGQYENSSITQGVVGYSINSRFGLQLNVPFIYREFKRPEGFDIDRGTESGLGDISLLLKTVVFRYSSGKRREFVVSGKNPVAIDHEADFTISMVALTGIKFPTGDTDRIKEEFNEVEIPGAPESGIHGHDLTLGTGSYDGIFGQATSLRYKNFFANVTTQFALRGAGLHDYDFANTISGDGGPGYFFIRNSKAIVGLQFVVSADHKDVDRFRGQPAEDTGMTMVSVGPRALASLGRWSVEGEFDLPVLIDNTALQVVPDYVIRGGLSFHF